MNSCAGVGIEGLRLILVTDFEHRVFNGSIIQAEGDLFKIAPSTRAVAVIQVRIDPVVSDDGRKR